MSYCHDCGSKVPDSWSPCPKCNPATVKTKSSLDVPPHVLVGCVILFLLFFFVVPVTSFGTYMFIGTVFLLVFLSATGMAAASGNGDDNLEEVVGDVSDGNAWIRSRFLLMNILAIAATSFGIGSITMNHIIFWGTLVLGGLIWAIPSKSKSAIVDDIE